MVLGLSGGKEYTLALDKRLVLGLESIICLSNSSDSPRVGVLGGVLAGRVPDLRPRPGMGRPCITSSFSLPLLRVGSGDSAHVPSEGIRRRCDFGIPNSLPVLVVGSGCIVHDLVL